MPIQRVGVVGCGLMGSGIAEVCARQGLETVVVDTDEAAVEAGRERIERSLSNAVRRGKLTDDLRTSAQEALTFAADLAVLRSCDLVVEAVTEDEAVKTSIFRTLDEVVTRPDAILASNTSSIPIMKLAMVTQRPEQVVGLHFFNPVPVLPLVELVSSLVTSPDTTEKAAAFASDVLHKHVIRSQDRAGFIVNALLIPYLL
jgi:3-hydroxybutyryl-CoA dehydrogenase